MGTSLRTRHGIASSTLLESGESACNLHRIVFFPTGRTESLNKCISTSTSMTHELRTKTQSPLEPDCSSHLDSDEGNEVYADSAGHPFCIGWGHPSREALASFVADRFGRKNLDSDK